MNVGSDSVDTSANTAKTVDQNSLFDEHGRLIPAPGIRVYNQVSRRYFVTNQPKIDYKEIHARFQKHLKTPGLFTAAEFEERAEKILEGIRKNPKTRHMLDGVHIPFFVSQDTGGDYGQELDEVYLNAVGQSFTEMFPKYSFTNHFKGILKGTFRTADEATRYSKFVEARKKGPVVGWYFATAMSEYALPDQVKALKNLPENFILSGALEATAAVVGSPDVLMKYDNFYPHLLALTATLPKEDNFFYFFESYGWNLNFNRRSYIGAVSEYFAGGLTVID